MSPSSLCAMLFLNHVSAFSVIGEGRSNCPTNLSHCDQVAKVWSLAAALTAAAHPLCRLGTWLSFTLTAA